MSDKGFIQDLVSDPKTWFGTMFTVVVGWVTFVLGARKQRSDIRKIDGEAKILDLEYDIKKEEFKDRKWKTMEDKNRALTLELEEAYKTILAIRKQLDVFENTIRQLTLKVQEQQVKINLHKIKNG